jgi:magnesium chelatase family protein
MTECFPLYNGLLRPSTPESQTDASGEKLLKAAVQQLHLSTRAYHRVLKLARTIADLAGSEMIVANHVAEAVQYRLRVGM